MKKYNKTCDIYFKRIYLKDGDVSQWLNIFVNKPGKKYEKRNNEINILKFIFAIVILLFHSKNIVPKEMQDHETLLFYNGSIAVEFFFLVSGYLMAASISCYKEEEILVGRDSRNFMLHKIKGLCPEIFIAWSIGYVVQHIAKKNVTVTSLVKDLMSGNSPVELVDI